MVNEILEQAGFVENVTYKSCEFITPPTSSYCVYEDDIEVCGSDEKARYTKHDIKLYLYEEPNEELSTQLEAVLNEYYASFIFGYTKQPKEFILAERHYETIYEFEYIEKL